MLKRSRAVRYKPSKKKEAVIFVCKGEGKCQNCVNKE